MEGAYSLVALTSKKLIGVRDPWGVRPLVLGKLDGAPILASETCALDIIGAEFVRDVEPGEMVVITKDGIESLSSLQPSSRAASASSNTSISRARIRSSKAATSMRRASASATSSRAKLRRLPTWSSRFPTLRRSCGARLCQRGRACRSNSASSATTMSAAPSSSRPTASAISACAGSTIPNRATLAGKRVVLIDDSIVRGTTSKKIVQMVRDAGAAEVHFRVASPPTTHSCFYGVDTPNTDDLLAHRDRRRRHAPPHRRGQPGLHFDGRALPRDGRGASAMPDAPQFCDACFSGEYPIELTDLTGGTKDVQLSLLADVA